MGFLIFAYRKLSLKRQINQYEFRQMTLSGSLQRIQEQMNIHQQAKSAGYDAFQEILQNGSSLASSLFQRSVNSITSEVNDKVKALEVARSGNDPGAIATAEANLKSAQESSFAKQNNAFAEFQLAQGVLSVAARSSSIFNAKSDDADMSSLQRQDTRITQEIASIESSLKNLRPQYESIEKAETEAAKQDAPKFGLS